MDSFTELEAWKVGLQLVEKIYQISAAFPPEEKYSLTSQIRSASNSILANIAEGFGRSTSADKASKYIIARGECSEVKAFILISQRLKFLSVSSSQDLFTLVDQTGRLISGLIKAYQNKS
jgi:four helix bundle protein